MVTSRANSLSAEQYAGWALAQDGGRSILNASHPEALLVPPEINGSTPYVKLGLQNPPAYVVLAPVSATVPQGMLLALSFIAYDAKGNPVGTADLAPTWQVTGTGTAPGAGSVSGSIFTGTAVGTVSVCVSALVTDGGSGVPLAVGCSPETVTVTAG